MFCVHCLSLLCSVYIFYHCYVLCTLFTIAMLCVHCLPLPCSVYIVYHCYVLCALFTIAMFCVHCLPLLCCVYIVYRCYVQHILVMLSINLVLSMAIRNCFSLQSLNLTGCCITWHGAEILAKIIKVHYLSNF